MPSWPACACTRRSRRRGCWPRCPAYDFGWAGFNSALNGAHLDTCLPNKAYEYVGCGLPVLTLQHRALSRLVGDRLGLTLTTLDDLAGQLAAVDVVELRRRIAERVSSSPWRRTFIGSPSSTRQWQGEGVREREL